MVAVGPSSNPKGEGRDPRVAIFPFENRTDDGSLDPLGQMVSDWIANGLMQIPEIQVVPHQVLTEVLAEAGERTGAPQETVLERVAAATGAGIGVTGAFYLRGRELEFHTQIVDLASEELLAIIQPVRGPTEDPVWGIDSVRIQVMGALGARFNPVLAWELPPTAQPPTYDAYLAYLQGMDFWIAGKYEEAARSFEGAFAADTTYLRVLLLAVAAHENAGDREQSDSLLTILLERREDLPRYDRYRVDFLNARRNGDHRGALAAARGGVDLMPTGILRLSLVLSLIENNRPAEAREEFEAWLATTPDAAANWYGTWTHYATILHILGDYRTELDVAVHGRGEGPAGQQPVVEAEARALAALGKLDELGRRISEMEALGFGGLADGSRFVPVAMELRAHGHVEASLELVDRTLRWYAGLDPALREGRAARELLASLMYLRERWSEAEGLWVALEEDAEGVELTRATGSRGAAAARMGDRAGAEDAIQRLATLGSSVPAALEQTNLYRARIAAVLGDRDRAVDLLRRAFAAGQPFGIWVHRDLDLESLRGYPPFEELVEPKG